MTFTLLPAVDVADGQAVRLVHGEAASETTYGAPRDAALAWQAGGAEWIHLVDLDAAFGRGSNAELLAAVIAEVDVNVQLSGGIRNDDSLNRALSTGCARVLVSTAALANPAWCARAIAAHGERIAVSLDVQVVKDQDGLARHQLAARGSGRDRGGDLWATLAWLEQIGCHRYVITDVSKDGTLHGPNVELYRAVADVITAPMIASGGISAIGDLVELVEVAAASEQLEGAIVGKALYAGRFTLPEALDEMRRFDKAAESRAHPREPSNDPPPAMDPDTASIQEISRELVRLQRQYAVASHEVGERGLRPDGIDDATLAWWFAAHRAVWRRRFEVSEPVTNTRPVEQAELRKTRLRKPTH